MEIFSPDLAKTVRRFPYAIIFAAVATVFLIGLTSELLTDVDETFVRLAAGAFIAAIFSIAGKLWDEAVTPPKWVALGLVVIVPILVGAAFQVRSFEWIMPFPLMAVGFLWLSIAPFTKLGRGAARDLQQNHFWWFNHRVITSAIIALAGLLIISIGLVAIERSMSVLFGLRSDRLFFGYILPFTAMFLTPVYWFSTIPERNEFAPNELEEPDFLSRAIGFLGQFVLVPLLLAYTAILLAYAAQIIINGALPEGTLGWMILGYLVIGAATWLILHPAFMHTRAIVRVFQNIWFWLTIVPIGLYGIALYTRINAYGLTPERSILVLGGIWAALLTLAFLLRRFGDIRLIPAIAAILLLLASAGPWNFHNIAIFDQVARFEAALDAAGWSPDNPNPNWPTEQAENAHSALSFLHHEDEELLHGVLAARGLKIKPEENSREIATALNLPEKTNQYSSYSTLSSSLDMPVSLGAYSVYLGNVNTSPNGPVQRLSGLEITSTDTKISVSREGVEIASAELKPWVLAQGSRAEKIIAPLIKLSGPQANFALLVNYASFENRDTLKVDVISGMLFTDQLPN